MPKLIKPDICVIGAGSGGLTVAAAAAAFGVEVALVEKARMGGDCLNHGCVPSKALLAAAERADAMRRAAHVGMDAVEPEIDFRKVHRHVHEVIDAIAPNDSVERFTALGVRVIEAEGRFVDRRTVMAADFEIKARRFVLATGAVPAIPPIPGLEAVDFLTNQTIFERTRQAARLVVLGGGPVGVELAQAHRRLGSEVVLVEAEQLLQREDREAVAILRERLLSEGIELYENTPVTSVERYGRTGARLHLGGKAEGTIVTGTHLLVATGRRPLTEGLGLEEARIAHGPDGISVDARLRTTNRRVHAIGDAVAGPKFTHLASHHAGIVLRSILFRLRARADRALVPRVTFTDPEIAHVGATEDEARAGHREIRVLRSPYSENDRAQTRRDTTGFVKLVTDRRGRILGVSIVGRQAGELISFWTLAISRKLGVRDVADLVLPYPTRSEIGKRAAIAYFSDVTRRPLVRRLIRFLRVFG